MQIDPYTCGHLSEHWRNQEDNNIKKYTRLKANNNSLIFSAVMKYDKNLAIPAMPRR